MPASSLDGGVPEGGTWRATGDRLELAGFAGAVTLGTIFDAWLLQPGLAPSGAVSAAATWEAGGFFVPAGDQITGLELEATLSQHFGIQSHVEVTVAGVARWHAFIVDDALLMSASVGQGISWATSVPVVEAERWIVARRLLSYNSYEVTFADPARPAMELVFRLHHRSGIFGVFGGAHEGSNVALVGLRYGLPLR